MIFIGIDNGLSGGLAAYDRDTGELRITPMPVIGVKTAKGNKNEYDIQEIIRWFDQLPKGPQMVVLEKAQAFPGQGVVSMFSVGRGFGIMEGILASRKWPYTIVSPKTWQKRMFEGVAHSDTKQASALVAQRLFPDTRFVATERSKKLHDGITDATMMAVYASRL